MNTVKNTILLLALVFTTSIYAQTLDTLRYEVDGAKFMSFVAKPNRISSETKTILIVHEWWGLNDYPKSRALMLAKEGFIAVCIDMYGEGVVVDNPKDASELAGKIYDEPRLLWMRFNAGYEAALKIKGVEPSRMAAIGYCFGGNVVLNAAKMGAPSWRINRSSFRKRQDESSCFSLQWCCR
jgi:dienelactone hydrolase